MIGAKRRAAVAASGVAAIVAALAACGADTSPALPAAPSATQSPQTASLPEPAARSQAGTSPAFTSGDGITVKSVQQIDSRLYDIALTSAAVRGALHIRVLVPDGYTEDPGRRYPVLYLFPGTGDTAAAWTEQGDAEAATAGRPLITVMPDLRVDAGGGYDSQGGGYCTNWFNRGRGGPPMWETFEISEVIPFIDRTLRTRATRAGRAIVGLSQGGFCSMSLASRHPDLFAAAASFSGVLDMTGNPTSIAQTTGEVTGATKLDHVSDPDAMFGSRAAQEINWAAHDPATLVTNLRGMRVWAYTGNGRRGPLDSPTGQIDASDEIEVHSLTLQWKAAAERAGIPVTVDSYGAGTHAWPYWQRDLRWLLGPLTAVLAHPPAPPARTGFTSADDPWSQWGYTVAIARPAREFSTLRGADASGFTLAGSGTASVVTPAAYRPGSRHRVSMAGPHARRALIARADRRGRLHLSVPLGPGNRAQQDTAAARAAGGTRVYATRVTISRG